jgi:hypothetical protein
VTDPDEAQDRERALIRRYRRLLLAYPRWHRRLHGPDQLTALLDLAGGGRPPTRRDEIGLVLDGLWCRVRVRGAAAVALAALVSLVAAATLAAAAGWVAWRLTVAPWPTVAEALSLAEPVVPRARPDSVTQRNAAIGPWLSDADSLLVTVLGSPELRPGGVYLSYAAAASDPAAVYASAAEVLAAHGWELSTVDGPVVAERDGRRLRVLCAGADLGMYDVVISVYLTPPVAAYGFAGLGAAVGGLLGWPAVAAAMARTRRLAPPRRAAVSGAATVGVVASLPAAVLNLIAVAIADSDAAAAPPWIGYTFVLARPGAVLGGALLVAAWLLSATGRSGLGGSLRAAGAGHDSHVD